MDALSPAPASFLERLAASTAGRSALSCRFGCSVLGASLVEFHVLNGGLLRLVDGASTATARAGSVERLLPDLIDATDVFVQPVAPGDGEPREPMTGAYMPIRRGTGELTGCYTILYPTRRGDLGPEERRTLHEIATALAEEIERARGDVPAAPGFAGLAAACADAIVETDDCNRILSWNAGAQRMFGYRAAEALGQPITLILPETLWSGEPADGTRPPVDLVARRKDGTPVMVEFALSRWSEAGGLRAGAILRDVTDRRALEAYLHRAAMTDHLTGLANRASLDERLGELLAAGRRATLLLVDLDGFKDVNDTLGHQAGDRVLSEVAARLRTHTQASNVLARMGGDEFVVLMEDTANPLEGSWLGETLIDAIEEAVPVEDQLVSISASIGIACSCDESTAESLLGAADLALYKSKRDGRGRAQLYMPELHVRLVEKGLARTELAGAWRNNQFELYYQPQVSLADGHLYGAEALIRWVHHTRGVLSPGAFLPILETDALATSVGDWIIDTACRRAAEWRRTICPGFRVAVNLFAVQFKAGDIVGDVARALERNDLPPDALELEITENTILKSDERILAQLRRLRDLGVGLSFDDFGTGYASLSMLRHYPVTKIKIDRSFVSGADVCDKDRAITQALVHMATGLGIEVVAEGIETAEQHALMRAQGCGFGQGYLYSRPVAAHAFHRLSRCGGQELSAAG